MNLSEQQRKALEHLGTPTLVVAGAGSGKTRTLTAKIAYLVEKGFEPERILAITFTNKAAEEMKARLVSQTGLDIARFPWVRTFHSACYKILRIHCTRLGFHNPLQIYDTYKQQKLLRNILAGKMNFDKKHVLPVLSQISNAKNSGNLSGYFDRRPRYSHIPMWDVYESYEKELIFQQVPGHAKKGGNRRHCAVDRARRNDVQTVPPQLGEAYSENLRGRSAPLSRLRASNADHIDP